MRTVILTNEEALQVQVALDWYYEPHTEHPTAARWRALCYGSTAAPAWGAPPSPPSPDVLWFAYSDAFFYKPVSPAGHDKFDCFLESTAFPGFYGFREHDPESFADYGLTFSEVPRPTPTTYPINPDCYLPPEPAP